MILIVKIHINNSIIYVEVFSLIGVCTPRFGHYVYSIKFNSYVGGSHERTCGSGKRR